MSRLTLVFLATFVGWLPQNVRDRITEPGPVGTAVVEGRVTIEVNESPRPVRRARVTLESDSPATLHKTDTDTDGRYRFEKVLPGRYRIRAEKPGFVSNARDSQRDINPSDALVLAADQSLSINLAMVRGAALEGRIQTDTGDPVVGAVVYAIRSGAGANDNRATTAQAQTDDRGRFRIHSLPAGDYSVETNAKAIAGSQRVSVGQGLEVAGLSFTVPATPMSGEETRRDSTGARDGLPAMAQPDGAATISGLVMRDGTNRPMPDVDVRVLLWDGGTGRSVAVTRTETDGRFFVGGLRAGEYGLMFSSERSVELWWGQRLPSDEPRRLQLADGQHFRKADMVIPRPLAIEGWLLDEFGDPAPGRLVQAARVVYAAGKRRLMTVPGGKTVLTDDLGRFRIYNLPPSEYCLVAPSGQFSGSSDTAGFAVTYYPGSGVSTDATLVPVDLQDVTGITFQMVPGRISTVSGVITDESGKPAPASIVLVPTTDGDVRAEILTKSQTGTDGTFAIPNVPTGSYSLQAFGRAVTGANSATPTFGALQLDVDGNVSGLVLKTTPAVTLRGRIVFEGPAPRPDPSKVVFTPVPVDFATGPVGGGPTPRVTNSDWTFEVKNLVGARVITAPLGVTGWMLKGVVRDGKDITDQPIDFRADDVTIEVTLTSNLSTVTGTVTDGNKPLADSQVVVFSENATKWAYPTRHVKAGRSDAKGAFTVSGLPPGNYLAVAYPPRQTPNTQDSATLEESRRSATALTVHEGASTTVSLRVVRR
jgi:hypothetical protein